MSIGHCTPSPPIVDSNLRIFDLSDLSSISQHCEDILSYRIEQYDAMDQLLAEEQKANGMPESNLEPHLVYNPARPEDYVPCWPMAPHLWTSSNTMRDACFNNEFEWPKNPQVRRHSKGMLKHAHVIWSPLDIQDWIRPGTINPVVYCTEEKATLMILLLHTLSVDQNIQILDNNNEQLFVYLHNSLKEVWDHRYPTDPNCTWINLKRLVHWSLNLQAEKYLPDSKKTDKQYNGSSWLAWIES